MKNWTLIFILLVITFSCGEEDDPGNGESNINILPSFEITMDSDVPGKVLLNNTTENSDGFNFFWSLWLSNEDGGELFISSDYSRSVSDDEDTYFFIQENGWIYVEFKIFNEDVELKEGKYFEVTNIPNNVVLNRIEVTSVSPTDINGNLWDGTGDGPDITVITVPTSTCGESSKTNWDVDIDNELPITLVAIEGTESRDSFSPQTREFYLYFADVEGHPSIISCQGVSSMGIIRLNPYNLTHVFNKGDDSNYPSVYQVETNSLKADIHLTWSLN